MNTEKIDGMSMNIEQTEMEKLKAVFPQCFAEGKLDIDKLLALCGEYIDNDFEKYKFEWKGKMESLKLAQKRSTGTLRPCREESVDFDDTQNLYIEGDNLEVLKLLQTAYYNKIKMIYIDPPYNTGNDFVYEDDFADPMARYKEVTQQTTKSNAETMGRYHTNWLNMMYPRLRLAYNLLTDDGVIFISINDIEAHNLRKLCDEIFGEENLLATFCWRTDGNFDNQAKVKVCHETILMYAKVAELFPAPPVIDPSIPSDSKLFKNEIRNTIIKNGIKNPISGVAIPVGFPCDFENGVINKEDVKWPQYSDSIIVKNGKTENEVIATTGWACKGQLEDYISANFKPVIDTKGQETNFVITKTGAIETIKTRSSNQSHVISVLTNLGGTQKASVSLGELAPFFNFPKPVELIKYLISMNTGENFIALDFFSGSATTAHAIMKLNAEDGGNRRFICVQLPEVCDENSAAFKAGYKNICEIGKERIRRAGKKLLEENTQMKLGEDTENSLDIGFKVFKLDTSNLKTWDSTPIDGDNVDYFYDRLNSMIESVKYDRTDMDVVYEVMLKMGITLDTPVTYIEVNGKIVYIVGEFLLMVCLAKNITAEDIEGIADYSPAKIVCAEAGFADDSALSNAHYILKDRSIELKLV